jgi:hypothetical protein
MERSRLVRESASAERHWPEYSKRPKIRMPESGGSRVLLNPLVFMQNIENTTLARCRLYELCAKY